MNSLQSKQTLIAIAVILFGFAGVFFLSGVVEKNRPPIPAGYEDEDLVLKGAKLKDFSLGLNGLIADWYWMQSLQYLGGKFAKNPDVKININDMRELNLTLLYPLLDNASSFDPQFLGVYEYGAVVLPAVDTAQAIKIVEKGIENNPKEWRLYNQLGYIYWKNEEYEKAANAYENASKIEGASPLMKAMVAKMKTEGGSRETARAIYTQMFEEAPDTNTKQTAELFLSKLDALYEMDEINPVLQNFKQKNNRCANDLREILPLLTNVKLPDNKDFRIDNNKNLVDPSGAPYILDKENCTVQLDKDKTKLPLD
jgi:tetratricopeptide (TPR) repeat protein